MTIHHIREGETPTKVAQEYGVTVCEIAQANGLTQKKSCPEMTPAEVDRAAQALVDNFEYGRDVFIPSSTCPQAPRPGEKQAFLERYHDESAHQDISWDLVPLKTAASRYFNHLEIEHQREQERLPEMERAKWNVEDIKYYISFSREKPSLLDKLELCCKEGNLECEFIILSSEVRSGRMSAASATEWLVKSAAAEKELASTYSIFDRMGSSAILVHCDEKDVYWTETTMAAAVTFALAAIPRGSRMKEKGSLTIQWPGKPVMPISW